MTVMMVNFQVSEGQDVSLGEGARLVSEFQPTLLSAFRAANCEVTPVTNFNTRSSASAVEDICWTV